MWRNEAQKGTEGTGIGTEDGPGVLGMGTGEGGERGTVCPEAQQVGGIFPDTRMVHPDHSFDPNGPIVGL